MRGFHRLTVMTCAALLATILAGALQRAAVPPAPAAVSLQESAPIERNRWYGGAGLRLFEQNMTRELPAKDIRTEYAGSYFEEDGRVKIGIVGEENLEKYRALVPKDRLEDGILSLECKRFSEQELQSLKEQLDCHFFEWDISHTAVDIKCNCVMIMVKSEAILETVAQHLTEEFPHVDPAVFHITVNPHGYARLEAH